MIENKERRVNLSEARDSEATADLPSERGAANPSLPDADRRARLQPIEAYGMNYYSCSGACGICCSGLIPNQRGKLKRSVPKPASANPNE